jgi:dTDP-4-amino-4,6-dideoxygalactose transaminase
MTFKIAFQRPKLVEIEDYLHHIKAIEASHFYSNYGPLNTQFEKQIVAEVYHSCGAATTVNNATTGLILAIGQAKRPGGRYALMPSFTFAATPLAAMWCGLEPYFIDIDPETWCPDLEVLDKLIRELGDEVAVVVPYATFGTAMPLEYYQSLQDQGIPVVVDAAPGFGTLDGEKGYGEGFSGTVVFSFHATKPFGIGEGGLVYSGDQQIITEIRHAANFGFDESRSSALMGLNGKLDEFSAAIGLVTLEQFSGKVSVRKEIETLYQTLLDERGAIDQGWKVQTRRGYGAAQFFSILCPSAQNNQEVVERLATKGIQARTYFSPSCHHQQQFQRYPSSRLDVTETVARRVVSLPLWEGMGDAEVEMVLDGLLR